MTDKQLLNAYLAGQPESLERLIRTHIDMVYATARRHVGTADADDITQAVFVMLVRKSAALRHRESLAGWLYRCTVFCCSNLKRTGQPRHF